jgi:hypothetical protein
MSTITVSLPDELVSKLRATAIRRKVEPDVIVGQALANQLEIDEAEPSGSTVAALIGQDFGKYEGVLDLSTNPHYLDDLGL